MFGIQMQHDACDVAPVSTYRIRVEQAQIRDYVFLVVNGQYGIGGRGIGDIGIKWWLLHGLSRNKIADDQFYVGLLGILMTPRSPLCFNEKSALPPMNGHRRFEPSGPKSANERTRFAGGAGGAVGRLRLPQ